MRRTDTIPAMLTPHEAVLNPVAADLVGRHRIAAFNAMGNAIAARSGRPSKRKGMPNFKERFTKPGGLEKGTEDVGMSPEDMHRFIAMMEQARQASGDEVLLWQNPQIPTTPIQMEIMRRNQERMNEEARARAMNEKPMFGFQYGTSDVVTDPNDPSLDINIPGRPGYVPRTDTVSDAYKQQLIDRILQGDYNKTYGPGSPRPTPSDMRQKVGAYDNPLRTGQVALSPSDYKLFTPEERIKYGIADLSYVKPGQPNPAGTIEKYFGEDARMASLSQTGLPQQQFPRNVSPPVGGTSTEPNIPYSQVPYGATQVPTTWTNYPGVGYVPQAVAVNQGPNYGAIAGSALQSLGSGISQSFAQQGQAAAQGMAQARANVPTSNPILDQLAADPLQFLRAAAQQAQFGGFQGFSGFGG